MIKLIIVLSCIGLLSGCDIIDTNPKYTYVGGEAMCFYGDELRKCSHASMKKIIEMDIKPLNGVMTDERHN